MALIKDALNFFKKGSEEEKKEPEVVQAKQAHPDIEPNGFYALPNDYAPVVVSSQGVSCRIDYQSHGEYVVTTHSKGRLLLRESLNARDRKKLMVTSFDFKGFIGIHLHPAGMVLALDEEKNAKGETRLNQPPATVLSGPTPPNDAQLRAGRILTIDLTTLSEGSPLLIASNNRLLHMMIKPLGTDKDSWGMYLSNINGIIRSNTLPSVVLRREWSRVVDRNFFIRLASAPEGRITASLWNTETRDPAMMRLTVDAAGVLTLEELFTTHGLTVVAGNGPVVRLGLLGDSPPPQEDALREQFVETLGKLRNRTQSCAAEHNQEERLQGIREHLLADVERAIRKESSNGVVMLALELAVKEVIALLYSKNSGAESGSMVGHSTVALLNAIIDELTGWVQTDSSTFLSAAVINQVIDEIAGSLPMPELEAMMRQELPKTKTNLLEEEQVHIEELRQNAQQFLTRFLTASTTSREVHHLARQITKAENPEEQKTLRAGLEQAVQKMMRETMVQTLIRLSVRGHLIRIEREKRQQFNFAPQSAGEQMVTVSELDDIVKRYNEYTRYISPAFQERLSIPIGNAIKAFQDGTCDEQSVTINNSGFISHLAVLRSSGGKLEPDSDATVPAITPLHAIPDAVPDIRVEQPDRAVAKGFVRVVHREGQLMEAEFVPMAHASKIPPGLPSPLWFVFTDFTIRFMESHIAGDSRRKGDQKQQDLIAQQFTHNLLLKLVNLFRCANSLPAATHFDGSQELLSEANGIAEMRAGEDPHEEVLDLRNRPKNLTEMAMNLKHELRQIIVKLQKEGAVPANAFRLKQQMRAFATAGGGGQQLSLPITITVQRGVLTLEALFDDKPFKKAVRLTGKAEEITAEPVQQEKPAAPDARKTTVASPTVADKERARILAVREKTEKLSRQGIAQLLNGLEFFKDFSDYEKNRVSEFDVSFQVTKRQDVLIRENTTDTAFFILIKGRVAAIKGNLGTGKEKVLFYLEAGEVMGELAFLTGTPRTLNLVSQEDGLLLRVDRELLERLGCDSREKFKDQLINKLVQRLTDTTNRVQKVTQLGQPLKRVHSPHPGELKQVSREETFEKIDRVPFFDRFSTFEKRRLTAFNTSFLTYPADAHVICEGDVDASFFILLDGIVAVLKGETEIVRIGPGEFFGEMAFLTHLPRTTGVCSKSEILVLKVDQDFLKRLGSEIREKIKDRFIRTLSERLIQTTTQSSLE
ncbi:MAG: cyclic nucleotide-binding domain-containing protein [Magnetococcales bacterium]|nr:cyclic nucleotide-binding domain-containing protein [Magnetococcales bacterium]